MKFYLESEDRLRLILNVLDDLRNGTLRNTSRERVRLERWLLFLERTEITYVHDASWGVNVLVLNRYFWPGKEEILETSICPFCGETHIHGMGEGHRVPHCDSAKILLIKLTAEDGTELYHANGYYIKDIDSDYERLF